MKRKLDFIVEFSEVGDFLYTPVRRLSGNYIKLSFAVAISVDPDILLVDEILFVGDVFFERKQKST